MHPNNLELFYWAAGLVAHIVLLIVLWLRHRARTFPIFTTLIAMNIVRSVTLYSVFHHGTPAAYRVVYMALALVDYSLQIGVAYELASHVFRPTGTWAPDVRKGFLILVIIGVVIAAAIACMPTPPEKTVLKSLLDRLNLFSSAVLCVLFVGMIRFSVTARLPWKTHVARIAQGLGFYSFLGILIAAGYNLFGEVRTSVVSQELTAIRLPIYLTFVVYWIITLWQEAPAPRELPEEMRKQLFTLQRQVEYSLRRLRELER